jgi:hypothetical protein
MSIRVWGAFKLHNENTTEHEFDDLSFKIVNIATQNQVGIKLGVNVLREFYKEYSGKNQYLPFEIIDNPSTNVAEILFSGQGIEISVGNKRVDIEEDLDSRMSRVQKFLEGIFNIGCIDNIVLHIIGGFGEESTHELKTHDFKSKMLELFLHEEDNWTPTVKLIISK